MKVKKIISVILCAVFLLLISTSTVKAVPLSSQIVQNVFTEVRYLPEGVELHLRHDKTHQNGDLNKDKRDQNVRALVVPKSSETVELVVWSSGTNHGWSKATVRDTIHDFERRNPGYTVLAAINGDFFDNDATYQPYTSLVSAGDVWKKDSLLMYDTLGIKADKSYVIGKLTANDYMSLKTVEGRVVTSDFKIDNINTLPTDDEISMFFPGSAQKLNVEGYTVYEGDYSIYRISKPDNYVVMDPLGKFVKGDIASVRSDLKQIDTIPQGKFYLISNNEALAEELQVGTALKCEYSLTGDWNGVENAIGLNHDLVRNGELLGWIQANTDVHPRSLIGIKEDGSYVLMTVDGRQPLKGAHGVTLFESGALLQEMGCVEGFNLDGGGSSTLIIRDENGVLQVMNMPSDGAERAIGNAILVVKRKDNIEVTDIGTRSFTVQQTGPVAQGTIQNIKVKLDNNEFQDLVGNKFVFRDLRKETNYNLYYTYEILDMSGRVLRSPVNLIKVTTLGAGVPEIGRFRISQTASTEISFRYKIDVDTETEIINSYIEYGERRYDIKELEGVVTITDLTSETEYEFELVVEYRYQGQDKVLTSETLTQTTGKATDSSGCGGSAIALYIGIVSFMAAGAFVGLRRRY